MSPMSEQTTYWGATLGKFPLLALVIEEKPAVAADLSADFSDPAVFEKNGVKGTPAHQAVSIGFLGVKIPLKK